MNTNRHNLAQKTSPNGRPLERRGVDSPIPDLDLRRPTWPLKQVWGGLLTFYLVALALNAASLHRNNEHMPYGPVRSFWVAVSAPLARVTTAVGLDRSRATLTRTIGDALNR